MNARTLTDGGIGASDITRSSRCRANSASRLSSFHSRHTMRTGSGSCLAGFDIADVTLGENIGAKLQIDQANADKQIAPVTHRQEAWSW